MTDEIYILKNDGQLEAMREQKFDLEDVLQQLVADHPELLSGQQIDPDNPRRWILVNREQGISDILGGGNRWALDHLLIDQDAIPTLVEVKRSENSEIRRTIVGQMLDYAAHARHTWSAGDIRRVFEERTTSAGQDSNNVLAELLQTDEDPDADEFWQLVETNLRAARLRLLFVADGIPDELTRVVEFLNEQMPGIEVLAVEIKQFLGDSGQTLVPKVIGRTAATAVRSATSRSNSKQFNREEFLDRMPSPDVREAANLLLKVSESRNGSLYWGNAGVTIRCHTPSRRSPVAVAWVYPPGVNIGLSGNCCFGAGNWSPNFFESLPTNLREVLENWADLFADDIFVHDVSSPGFKAWAISLEDAAANIDVLANRLDKVLSDLGALESEVDPENLTSS